MSSLPIEMVPHSRDDLRSDLPDAHGPTTADILNVLSLAASQEARFAFEAKGELGRFFHGRKAAAFRAARDFILSQSAADLPPADRATAQPPAAEVRATRDGGA